MGQNIVYEAGLPPKRKVPEATPGVEKQPPGMKSLVSVPRTIPNPVVKAYSKGPVTKDVVQKQEGKTQVQQQPPKPVQEAEKVADVALTLTVKNKGGRGKRVKLTQENLSKMGELVGIGVPIETVLLHLRMNMTRETFYQCLRRQPEMEAWYEQVKADKVVYMVNAIHNAPTPKDMPTGKCWLLERRYSELFAKKPDTQVTVTQVSGVSQDVWQKASKLLKDRNAAKETKQR